MATLAKMAVALASVVAVDAANTATAQECASGRTADAEGSSTTCSELSETQADAETRQDHLLLQLAPAKRHSVALMSDGPFTWQPSEEVVSANQWCQAQAPTAGWTLKHCSADGGASQQARVLSYNLYWWNLFGSQFRNGNGGSAGHLIAQSGSSRPFDFMGFQECEDVHRVLGDAGLTGAYGAIEADHAIAMAYHTASWTVLEHGMDEVGEDRSDQWWGKRGAMWARFKSTSSDKTVLFVNHHGPLPVGTGGLCGARATAFNILRTIASHARAGDGIVLVGDFNSDAGTSEIQELSLRLHRVHTGVSFGGVDHIFSSCGDGRVISHNNLGDGGSDHQAVDAIIEL